MLHYTQHLSYIKDKIQGRNTDLPKSHFLHRCMGIDGLQIYLHMKCNPSCQVFWYPPLVNLYSHNSEYWDIEDIYEMTYIFMIQPFSFNCRDFCYVLVLKLLYLYLNMKISWWRENWQKHNLWLSLFACSSAVSNQIVTFLSCSYAFISHSFQSQFFCKVITQAEKLNIYLLWALILVKINIQILVKSDQWNTVWSF